MGEAKRRKKLDPNYGKQKLSCFLQKAQISDSHAIYLQLPNESNLRIISIHKKIEAAYDILCKCNQLLSTIVIDSNESSEELLRRFLRKLITTHGNYESDNAQSLITEHGVTYVKDPISRKYIVMPIAPPDVYCVGLKDCVNKFLNGLDDRLSKKPDKCESDISGFVLQTVNDEKMLHCFSYFTAAYIADYMSDNDLELPIATKVVCMLVNKANDLKRRIKIINNIE